MTAQHCIASGILSTSILAMDKYALQHPLKNFVNSFAILLGENEKNPSWVNE
jgi:hypothetical protein